MKATQVVELDSHGVFVEPDRGVVDQILPHLAAALAADGGASWVALGVLATSAGPDLRQAALTRLLAQRPVMDAFGFFLTSSEAEVLGEQLQHAALTPPMCARCDKHNADMPSEHCAVCADGLDNQPPIGGV